MTVKRMVTTIAAFLVFLGAISAGAGAAVAEPDLPECRTTPWRSDVVHQWRTGSWGYLYRVVWCVEETTITWAVPEVVPVLPDGSDCTWGGTARENLGPVGDSESWTGFSMGMFTCPNGDQGQLDYPWGVVLVHPDGTSEIAGQGTA